MSAQSLATFLGSPEIFGTVSKYYTMPGNTEQMQPVEELCLILAQRCEGLFAALDIGVVRTNRVALISSLVMGARRPVMLLPANLVQQTRNEIVVLRTQWLIPPALYMISYEALSSPGHREDLLHLKPDLIISRDFSKLGAHNACTRRVDEYMTKNKEAKFVAFSHTNDVERYPHVVGWCLKDKAPALGEGYRERLLSSPGVIVGSLNG